MRTFLPKASHSLYRLRLTKPLQLVHHTLHHREGAVLSLPLSDGTTIYGDLCPLPSIHRESLGSALLQWQKLVVPALARLQLCKEGFAPSQPFLGLLVDKEGAAAQQGNLGKLWTKLYPSVAFGLETALWLWYEHQLCEGLPSKYEQGAGPSRPTAIVFYPKTSSEWLDEARAQYAAGYRIFKIKIGGVGWDQQKAAISQLVSDCPLLKIRLDANHQLSRADYDDPLLLSWPIEFVEDALPSTEGSNQLPWAEAIDEPLWDYDLDLSNDKTPQGHIAAQSDVLVLKPARLGGLSKAWRWFAWAKQHGKSAHLSSCYESGIGVTALLSLQRHAEERFGEGTVLAGGFSPYFALAEDVLSPPLRLDKPKLSKIKPHIEQGYEPYQEQDQVKERWLAALDRDGPCLLTAAGEISYRQLSQRVQEDIDKIGSFAPEAWQLDASDTLTVWSATLACLIAGHRLLPIHNQTPKVQRDTWARQLQGLSVGQSQTLSQTICRDRGQGGVLIGTSGSTGARKLAWLPSSALYYSALGSTMFYGLNSTDIWGLCLPLFHVGGLMILLRATLAGAAVVDLPRSKASSSQSAALCAKVTMLSVVPTQLGEIVQALSPKPGSSTAEGSAEAVSSMWQGLEPRRLKAVIVGGAAAEPALISSASDAGLPLSLTYGMTESCSQLLATKPAAPNMQPLPFREVKIIGGKIAFRGPMTFGGYIGAAQEADQRDSDDGAEPHNKPQEWQHSEDLAEWRNGGIVILGRADRIIIKGGENIPLAAAEQIAAKAGLLSRAVAVEHQRFGQSYCLVVAKESQAVQAPADPLPTPAEEQLLRQLKAQLPKFWLPDRIIWLKRSEVAGIKISEQEARSALDTH